MARKEELQNAKKVFQNGTPKQKWEFIWDYYKWHLIILALALGFLAYVVYNQVTAKECVLDGVFLNSMSTEETVTELEQGFFDHSSIDTKEEEVRFTTNLHFSSDASSAGVAMSYETLQLISAQVAAGEMDFMVGDVTSMTNFAYWQYFCDLSEVLSEEMMEKYEPYFHYYDRAVVQELGRTQASDDMLSPIIFPDSRKPELMEDPVPIFIDVSACEELRGLYPSLENGYVLAFAVNSENRSAAADFLDYLFDDNHALLP